MRARLGHNRDFGTKQETRCCRRAVRENVDDDHDLVTIWSTRYSILKGPRWVRNRRNGTVKAGAIPEVPTAVSFCLQVISSNRSNSVLATKSLESSNIFAQNDNGASNMAVVVSFAAIINTMPS